MGFVLQTIFNNGNIFYGEEKTIVSYGIYDLLWKSYGGLVRFCLVNHPARGKVIFMTTDLNLTAEQIVVSYSKRFKIEYSFKELKHIIGAFSYRFWIKGMRKTRRSEGDRYIHRESKRLKNKISIKMSEPSLYSNRYYRSRTLSIFISLSFRRSLEMSQELVENHTAWGCRICSGYSKGLKKYATGFSMDFASDQVQKFAEKYGVPGLLENKPHRGTSPSQM